MKVLDWKDYLDYEDDDINFEKVKQKPRQKIKSKKKETEEERLRRIEAERNQARD